MTTLSRKRIAAFALATGVIVAGAGTVGLALNRHPVAVQLADRRPLEIAG